MPLLGTDTTKGQSVKRRSSIVLVHLASFVLGISSAFAGPGQQEASSAKDTLFTKVAGLDNAMFDAFNHCSDPGQLKLHASYFAPDIEFYHDTGGVTWTRDEMIANTKKHACGNYRRELVPGTLQVFPIKDFGALARGTHRFCQIDTGKCDGKADFVLLWRQKDGQWQITRSFSFGHRPNE